MTQPAVKHKEEKRGRTKNNTKERRKRQVGGRGNEKDQLDDAGSRILYLSTHLSVCLFAYYYTSSLCASGNGGDKRALFCGTALLHYSLVSVHVTWSALLCNL